jgi:hypothetical protein
MALNKVLTDGLMTTVDSVRSKLDQPHCQKLRIESNVMSAMPSISYDRVYRLCFHMHQPIKSRCKYV